MSDIEAPIGYLVNGKTVMCRECVLSPSVLPELDIEGVPTRLYAENVARYNQHCHTCGKELARGVFNCELFIIGPDKPIRG